jgi:hypothetical protein
MVSAAPRSAPARACEPWVGRRGWPLSAHPEGELRLPASAARFILPAGGRKSEALLDATSPSDPFRTLHSACASHRAVRHLRRAVPSSSDPGTCVPSPRTRVRPLSASSFCLEPRLHAAFGFRLGPRLRAAFPLSCRPSLARRAPLLLRTALAYRAPLPVEPCPGIPRNFRSAWAALPFRNYRGFHIPEPFPMRFPEGTCTVSGPCKLLILLWFPAVRPSRLQS